MHEEFMEVLAQNRFSHHLTLDVWDRINVCIRCSTGVYKRLVASLQILSNIPRWKIISGWKSLPWVQVLRTSWLIPNKTTSLNFVFTLQQNINSLWIPFLQWRMEFIKVLPHRIHCVPWWELPIFFFSLSFHFCLRVQNGICFKVNLSCPALWH